MAEICSTCGLPKELCSCDIIAKERQKIVVRLENKRFNKPYTTIAGIDVKEIDIKEVMKKLKGRFACGGTVKEGRIELQGNHKSRVKGVLVEMGFLPQSIEVR
ncbi:MAG TPA: translation initiation factor [Candidatus Nanoarchaeia archaeon]|nr:translation initiation factor [Candidatus Nanoarchaeia archaeon]